MGKGERLGGIEGLAEDGMWPGCLQTPFFGGVHTGKIPSVPPATCTPQPDLSTDLTGEIFPPRRFSAGRKGLGNERLDVQRDLRKNACPELRQNVADLCLKALALPNEPAPLFRLLRLYKGFYRDWDCH